MKLTKSSLLLFCSFLLSLNAIAQEPTQYKWENGNLKAEGKLIQGGIEDGMWKYYDQEGKIKQEVSYNFGVFEGPYKQYFDNGKVSEEGNFKKARLHGEFKTYYRGIITGRKTYKSNKLNGVVQKDYKDALAGCGAASIVRRSSSHSRPSGASALVAKQRGGTGRGETRHAARLRRLTMLR